MEDFDVVYFGFGLAGASHFLQNFERYRKLKIGIFERRQLDSGHKTICSFSKEQSPYAENSWDRYYASSKKFETNIPYVHYSTTMLAEKAKSIIGKCDNILLFENTSVTHLKKEKELFSFFVGKQKFTTHKVFDSRTPDISRVKDQIMYQHFYGRFLEFDDPHEYEFPLIMDLREFNEGLKFFYIIPISPTRLLVELTYFSSQVFSEDIYESELRKYLNEKFNAGFDLKEIEKGVIPLAEIRNTVNQDGYIPIGIRAGTLRPSTGYSFERNMFMLQNELYEKPRLFQKFKWRMIVWMDLVFLTVLKSRPRESYFLFKRFFSRLRGNTIADFMGSNPRFLTLLKVILSMPTIPFIWAGMTQIFKKRDQIIIRGLND